MTSVNDTISAAGGSNAEYAAALRTDTTQDVVARVDTLDELRAKLALLRATPPDAGRYVGLMRRPPAAPMWQEIEP